MQSIEIELVNSIVAEKYMEVTRDVAEATLDSVLQDGVLKEIPIIGTLSRLYQAGIKLQQQFYIKKIALFLAELSAVPLEKRERFVQELENKAQSKRKFGETILLLLDKADHMEKPVIVGKIMKHHILGTIAYGQALRLCAIVNKSYLPDLKYLTNFQAGLQQGATQSADIAATLQSIGLLSFAGLSGGGFDPSIDPGGVFYELNEYGRLLIQYGLSE